MEQYKQGITKKGLINTPLFFFVVWPIELVDIILIAGVCVLLIILCVIVLFAFREVSFRRKTRMHIFGNPLQVGHTEDDQHIYTFEDMRMEIIGRIDILQSEIEENADFIKGIGYATIISTIVLLFIVIRVF